MRLASVSTELLEPDQAGLSTVPLSTVPGWARDAMRPLPPPGAEEHTRIVLSLHSDDGAVGRFGPISPSVRQIVVDQLAPALTGRSMKSWRWLEEAEMSGRHKSGSHYRIAWSAVELAAWDLRAAAEGGNVLELLSSDPRTSVPVYASALGFDMSHPGAPDIARWLAEGGYYGQKWQLPLIPDACTPGEALRLAENIREAAGDEVRLMIDGQGRWDHNLCRQIIHGLADIGVTWIEEPTAGSRHGQPPPVPPGYEGLLAAGEHAYELEEQLSLVRHPSIGVLQPDIAWQGGLSRALLLTTVARAADKVVIPHGASFCMGLVLGAASPATVPAVEYHLTLEPRRQAIYTTPASPAGGYAALPQGPGFGLGYRC